MIVRGSNKGREGKVTSVYVSLIPRRLSPHTHRAAPKICRPRRARYPREVERTVSSHRHPPEQGRRHQAQAG
jgi:hypothetical protein